MRRWAVVAVAVAVCCLAACDSLTDPLAEPPGPSKQGRPDQSKQGVGEFCGGFAGFGCPEGLSCADDPNDSCDPTQGGADCGGICVEPGKDKKDKKPKKDECEVPERIYISEDPETCATLRFFCETGFEPFSDECGCGCAPAPLPEP
ncbi:MAG TPA: hypothetical protein VK447_01245 [Myxococcaceae bacterium]|nr:hypothetical protein [Myxococcaceae bacterium]